MLCCSPGDVRRQMPVRLVQEDLLALRHLLLQQPRLPPVQVLRLNATANKLVITIQQEHSEINDRSLIRFLSITHTLWLQQGT